MNSSKKIPYYEGLDISYDFCNQKYVISSNVKGDARSGLLEKALEKNMIKEDLGNNKKRKIEEIGICNISIRNYKNGKDNLEIVNNIGDDELTDDILTDLLGEINNPGLFGIKEY